MAINPLCDFCKKELIDYGGLLFSPPDADSRVKKYHLCASCFTRIEDELI